MMTKHTSLFLDLLRLAAALFVVASHASWKKISGGVIPQFPGHAAVMVFFVLSGYVVAYAVATRERTLERYTLSRLSRLFSVVIPALALTAALDAAGTSMVPALYAPEHQTDALGRIAMAALFVNQIWFLDVTVLSNEPFWSLPYEFWYYALFGASYYLRGRVRVVAMSLIVLVMGPKILLYLPIWYLGVWLYRQPPPRLSVASARGIALLLAVVSAGLYLVGYKTRLDTPWLPVGFSLADYPLAACVAAIIWLADACRFPIERFESAIRTMASWTFSIYLYHVPILLFVVALLPFGIPPALRLGIALPATLIACAVFAQFTESRKAQFRTALEWMASPWRPRRVSVAAGTTGRDA